MSIYSLSVGENKLHAPASITHNVETILYYNVNYLSFTKSYTIVVFRTLYTKHFVIVSHIYLENLLPIDIIRLCKMSTPSKKSDYVLGSEFTVVAFIFSIHNSIRF